LKITFLDHTLAQDRQVQCHSSLFKFCVVDRGFP